MIFRAFILSVLFLSYGSIMGHEVFFGHHTSADINCHNDVSDCCDHHHGPEDHLPCLVDIDPHIGSVQDLLIYPDEGTEIDLTLHILVVLQNADIEIADDKDGPPGRIIPELFSSLFMRSHRLRGPPVA